MNKLTCWLVFFSVGFLVPVSASADWYSQSWPSLRARIEEPQHSPGVVRSVMECEPSKVQVSPSFELGGGLGVHLAYPDAKYWKDCYPADGPVYTVFHRDGEIIVYSLYEIKGTQPPHSPGVVRSVLKEWIYTEEPNVPEGSHYSWDISGAENVRQDDQGRVHVIAKEASYIIDPVVYWTKDDAQHAANWQVTTPTPGVAVVIDARAEDYPLLIDPTVNYGQWLGGNDSDSVSALVVNGDEIYAGGYSVQSTSWESVTFAGAHSGSFEGFVIEIADGGTPSLVWGQWLGGNDEDIVYALAVTGDEIYAGGYSVQSTSWEAGGWLGSHSDWEGFVVEIADGATPSLAWKARLGGVSYDTVYALAVTGDEIYAGGSSNDPSSWESVTFAGVFNAGSDQGFVIEIADGDSVRSLVWGQWLGGDQNTEVFALAVTGDEIYAGGETSRSTSWESVTFAGAHGSLSEGFVIEIADGGTPALAWGQWLGGGTGGSGSTQVLALAVTGDEIYAGGFSDIASNWESVTFQGTFSATSNEGFVIEVADGGTPALAWGQWLGGDGSSKVLALAVTGDEIYAGGYSTQSTSFEAVLTGAHSGGSEGFVIEIADDGTPSLVWGQWLGGDGSDIIYALAVTGDEIYAGGETIRSTSWESVTFAGVHSGNSEGFVIEISDAAASGGGGAQDVMFFGPMF